MTVFQNVIFYQTKSLQKKFQWQREIVKIGCSAINMLWHVSNRFYCQKTKFGHTITFPLKLKKPRCHNFSRKDLNFFCNDLVWKTVASIFLFLCFLVHPNPYQTFAAKNLHCQQRMLTIPKKRSRHWMNLWTILIGIANIGMEFGTK